MKVHYLRMVRRAFRALRHKKLRHRPWWQKISKPLFHRSLWVPCRDTVATGLAIGLFFSMMPFIPQSIFAAILAMRAKVNVPFAMAACFVSNPFTNVPFWYAQIHVGQWLINTLSLPVLPGQITLPIVGIVSASNFIVGFVAMGVLLALSAYPLVHLFSAILPHHLPVRRHGMKPVRVPAVPAERSVGP
ncbi:MAG: DUF2062 domain-containing protein [Verrucomicrobiota bacterium]